MLLECTSPWRVRGHEQPLSFASLPHMARTVHDITGVPAAADSCVPQLHPCAPSSLLALTPCHWPAAAIPITPDKERALSTSVCLWGSTCTFLHPNTASHTKLCSESKRDVGRLCIDFLAFQVRCQTKPVQEGQ